MGSKWYGASCDLLCPAVGGEGGQRPAAAHPQVHGQVALVQQQQGVELEHRLHVQTAI
jgi:hypothetical protein